MKAKFVNESIEDFVVNSSQSIYDKYRQLNNLLRSNYKNSIKYFKSQKDLINAQLDFSKLINLINITSNKNLIEKDINSLDNKTLLILDNGLNNIIEDYELESIINPIYNPENWIESEHTKYTSPLKNKKNMSSVLLKNLVNQNI